MNPQEAAIALVSKFRDIKLYNKHAAISEEEEHAKRCALICVQREKELLAHLHSEIPLDPFPKAFKKWRVSIENAGIENEQITTEIQNL